jgi:hypothetical protein
VLYSAQAKFDSGCGWPAFDKAYAGALKTETDITFGMKRVGESPTFPRGAGRKHGASLYSRKRSSLPTPAPPPLLFLSAYLSSSPQLLCSFFRPHTTNSN